MCLSATLTTQLIIEISCCKLIDLQKGSPTFCFLLCFSGIFNLRKLHPCPVCQMLQCLPKGIILIFHHKIKYIPACSASEAVIHLLRRCYRKRGRFLIMKRTKSKIGTSSFVQLHILGYNIYNIILHPDFFNDIV